MFQLFNNNKWHLLTQVSFNVYTDDTDVRFNGRFIPKSTVETELRECHFMVYLYLSIVFNLYNFLCQLFVQFLFFNYFIAFNTRF